MIRRPPRSTRTDTLFPYTPLFRSHARPGLPSDWAHSCAAKGPRRVATPHPRRRRQATGDGSAPLVLLHCPACAPWPCDRMGLRGVEGILWKRRLANKARVSLSSWAQCPSAEFRPLGRSEERRVGKECVGRG